MDYFSDLRGTVARALEEDVQGGDITAQIINETTSVTARVISRETAIICGQPWVDEVARQVDPELVVTWHVKDGDQIHENDLLFKVQGGMTIVDATTIGIGRDPRALARIARATGLNVIMGAGYYVGVTHPDGMGARCRIRAGGPGAWRLR